MWSSVIRQPRAAEHVLLEHHVVSENRAGHQLRPRADPAAAADHAAVADHRARPRAERARGSASGRPRPRPGPSHAPATMTPWQPTCAPGSSTVVASACAQPAWWYGARPPAACRCTAPSWRPQPAPSDDARVDHDVGAEHDVVRDLDTGRREQTRRALGGDEAAHRHRRRRSATGSAASCSLAICAWRRSRSSSRLRAYFSATTARAVEQPGAAPSRPAPSPIAAGRAWRARAAARSPAPPAGHRAEQLDERVGVSCGRHGARARARG